MIQFVGRDAYKQFWNFSKDEKENLATQLAIELPALRGKVGASHQSLRRILMQCGRTLRHGCRLIKIRLMSRRQQRKALDLPGRDRESVPRRSACLRQSIILIIEARVW